MATVRGDYLDGEFQGFANGKVRMNSPLFGPSTLDRAEIIEVNVHPPQSPVPKPKFIVRSEDGGIYMANSLTPDAQMGTVVVQEKLAGSLEFPLRELLAVEMP